MATESYRRISVDLSKRIREIEDDLKIGLRPLAALDLEARLDELKKWEKRFQAAFHNSVVHAVRSGAGADDREIKMKTV